MRADGRFDGHIIQGHVDTTGKIEKMREIAAGVEIMVRFDGKHRNSVVEKGSVSVNGVSLTAYDVKDDSFMISMIPETLKRTTFFSFLKQGSDVNIEFDILGKYVARIMENGSKESNLQSLLEKL
jgi:riboflavin synthase